MAGKLITLETSDLLQEGADPYQVWRVVKELWDKLNDLTFTIVPDAAGRVEVADGEIRFILKVITQQDAPSVIPGYAPLGSGIESTGSFDSGRTFVGSSG